MTVTTEAAPQEPTPPEKRRNRGRILLLVAVVAVAGVGGFIGQRVFAAEPHDHSSHSHAPDVDACSLVPENDAQRILGPVGELSGDGTGVVSDQAVCFIPLRENPRYGATVGYADFEVAPKYRGFAQGFPGVTEAIDGLGDQAVWVSIFRVAVVRAGDELVSVQMTDVFEDEAVARDKATNIARLVLDRLEDR